MVEVLHAAALQEGVAAVLLVGTEEEKSFRGDFFRSWYYYFFLTGISAEQQLMKSAAKTKVESETFMLAGLMETVSGRLQRCTLTPR